MKKTKRIVAFLLAAFIITTTLPNEVLAEEPELERVPVNGWVAAEFEDINVYNSKENFSLHYEECVIEENEYIHKRLKPVPVGTTVKLINISADPYDVKTIKMTSEDPSIATVKFKGTTATIKGIRYGQTYIDIKVPEVDGNITEYTHFYYPATTFRVRVNVTPAAPTLKVENRGGSAINKDKAVKFSWNKVEGANGYKVYYKDNGKWIELATINDANVTSYTSYAGVGKDYVESPNHVRNMTNCDKKMTYAVCATSVFGNGELGKAVNRYYEGIGLYKAKVVKNKKKKPVSIQVDWGDDSKRDYDLVKKEWKKPDWSYWVNPQSRYGMRYQLQISTDKKFNNPKNIKSYTRNLDKGATFDFKKYRKNGTTCALKKGKTYYIRIRGYVDKDDTRYYTQWSPVKKVNFK